MGKSDRPWTVWLALLFTYAGGGLFILLGVFAMVAGLNPTMFHEVAGKEDLKGLAPTVLQGILGAMGISGLVFGGLAVLLAVFAGRGGNRARKGLTVLGALCVLAGAGNALNGAPQALVGAGYVLLATVLWWVGGANAWYQTHPSAARTRQREGK